ncbi:MAG: DUF4202 domain-containing protein [Acidimicrobiales bacterium]
MKSDGSALAAVLRRVDEINAADPNTLTVDGVERPKELVHAEMMTEWLLRLDPEAGTEQRIAARAHHLRRWALPRSEYPEGRAGYLKWRTELSRRHAAEVTAIMADEGFGPEPIDRVTQIVRKRDIKGDPAVQTHEDALCLVFLSTQFEKLIADHGEDKVVEIVAKTLAKMSADGIAHANALDYTPTERAVLDRAVASIA